MPDFLPAQPHGPITEPFPDVFFVTGGYRFGPAMSITRNMTIVRQGKELVLINSVRLDKEGEAALENLGEVKHLVRIGAFHGADDAYFKHRYSPTFWAPPKTKHAPGLSADRELVPGESPLDESTVFAFGKGKLPEAAIVLDRDGGLLITCDSYQNWTTFEGSSLLGKAVLWAMGFGPTLIGGPWTKAMGPEIRADFNRMRELPFTHLLPAHGTVLKKTAKEGLATAIAHRFKDA